jgi:hypothetical protein
MLNKCGYQVKATNIMQTSYYKLYTNICKADKVGVSSDTPIFIAEYGESNYHAIRNPAISQLYRVPRRKYKKRATSGTCNPQCNSSFLTHF